MQNSTQSRPNPSRRNVLKLLAAAGVTAEVTYPGAADFIQVRLTPDTVQTGPLFNAIPLRQNTRSAYDGQRVKTADLAN